METKTNQTIIETFIQESKHRQFLNRRQTERIHQAHPELFDLQNQLSLLGLTYTKEKIEGNVNAEDNFSTNAKIISDKIAQYLKLHQIPPDYISQKFECDACHDSGYVEGHMCHCLKAKLAEGAFARFDLRPSAKDENFQTYNIDFYPSEDQQMAEKRKRFFLKYCKNFSEVKENYLFIGKTGLGKTFLSNAIAGQLIEQGRDVIYITAAHLVRLVQDHLYTEGVNIERLYHALFECDLLIIDDLGAEYSTKFSGNQLFEIINGRIQSGKPMIISTNLTSREIKYQYNERLSSRIGGYFTAITFNGKDIRLVKNQTKSTSLHT